MNLTSIKETLLEENPPLVLSRGRRIQNLDALKLMSLVLVSCVHCAMTYDYYNPAVSIWSVTRLVYNMGVLAIPMFFAVSGYQLLGRENAGYRYVVRKILNLLKASFVFYLFIKMLLWLFWGEMVDVLRIPLQFTLNLVQIGDYSFLWFVGGLILVYLCYPLVNKLYVGHKGLFCLLYAFILLFQTFIFYITIVKPSSFILNEYNVWQTFRLWNWIGYFCLGGLIKRYRVFALLGRLLYVIVMAAVCFVFLNLLIIKRGMWLCEYGYGSLPVILFVAVVFSYVMKFRMNSRFLTEIALVFFPAYLLGYIFIRALTDYLVGLPHIVGAPVFGAVVTICAVASGWLLMQVPLVRKILKF